jgi:hypothetical protein
LAVEEEYSASAIYTVPVIMMNCHAAIAAAVASVLLYFLHYWYGSDAVALMPLLQLTR